MDYLDLQRSGDFGIARLGGVATLNIQRLVYRPPDVAWDAITSHLLFVLRNPAAPQPIRLQAARTLDDVLAIVPRHVAAVPSDLQADVQRRVLDVLAQQIVLDSSPPGSASSTSMELRRMGLETPHQSTRRHPPIHRAGACCRLGTCRRRDTLRLSRSHSSA